MAGKTMQIQADRSLREELAAALRFYAEAAYPPGCSECGQAAREALLNTEAQLLQDTDSGPVTISRRVKPRLKAALEYYCEYHSEANLQQLLGLLD